MDTQAGVDRRSFIKLLSAAGVTVVAGAATTATATAATATAAAPAANAATASRAPHQPYMHGYNAAGLKAWTPASDPYAKYFRSRVPLAPRISPFTPTQANPRLKSLAQVMNMSYDYDNSFFTAYRYNDDYARRLLRFWQYSDMWNPWHGMPIAGSPTEEPEHGLINLPNPAYTDAAHRNGVRVLAGWFWPRPGDFGDYLSQREDGSFPVADALLAMAEYFGYEGYFINQEATISKEDAAGLMAMLKYLRAKAPAGFHLQMYDSLLTDGTLTYQNRFNEKNAAWVAHDGKPVNNSVFVNYAWNAERVATSAATAAKLDMNVYDVAFLGTENEKYGFNPPYDTRHVFPEGKDAQTSWALFGSHFAWANNPDRENPDKQDDSFLRERRYWSGPNQDPARTGRTEYVPWPDNGKPNDPDNHKKWDGVAHYIAERSVIGELPFTTRFNTGHGRSFFHRGVKSGAGDWNNAGIQDILPTWQWWTRSEGSGAPLDVDYDHTTAWDGGTSLKISGALGPDNATTVRLYKTDLKVSAGDRARLTYTTGNSGARSGLQLGVVTKEAPDKTEWLRVGRTGRGAWTTAELDLGRFRGRTIAALALRVSSETATDYRLNLGELALLPRTRPTAPRRPTGFTVDEVHRAADGASAEVFLSWKLDPSADWYYDIWRESEDGEHESLGRVLDDVYYLKSLRRHGSQRSSVLKLTAVSKDGTRSAEARARVLWS